MSYTLTHEYSLALPCLTLVCTLPVVLFESLRADQSF